MHRIWRTTQVKSRQPSFPAEFERFQSPDRLENNWIKQNTAIDGNSDPFSTSARSLRDFFPHFSRELISTYTAN